MIEIDDVTFSMQVPGLIHDEFIRKGHLQMPDGGTRPIMYSGGFAVVMKFDVDGEMWAFRCWHKKIGNMSRLQKLSEEIEKLQLPFFCQFTYKPEGIVVKGKKLPTTRMRWIEGCNLKDYVYQHKNEPQILETLARNFKNMCKKLHFYHFAHGDLQHGNILVGNEGQLYLIDYDSIYIPSIDGVEDNIYGLPDYQHPCRTNNKIANRKMDYFSELIIYISILAIARKPSLADDYAINDNDRMLFSKNDFKDIKESKVYEDIRALPSKEILGLLDILEGYLQQSDITKLAPFDFMSQIKSMGIVYDSTSYCTNCGVRYRNNEDNIYCVNCGNHLYDIKA